MNTTEEQNQAKEHKGGTQEDAQSVTEPEGHGMARSESLLDADFVQHPLNRRNVLMTIGIGLNALVGLAIAGPVPVGLYSWTSPSARRVTTSPG